MEDFGRSVTIFCNPVLINDIFPNVLFKQFPILFNKPL